METGRFVRQCVIGNAQRERLLEAVRPYLKDEGRTACVRTLYFDTRDGSVARRVLGGAPFAEVFTIQSEATELTGDTCVKMALDRRTLQRWTRREIACTLRDVELFMRSGIRPPGISAPALMEILAYRRRVPVRPAMVISADVLSMDGGDGVSLYLENNTRVRRMALSLEAGDFGKRILPEGHAVLRVEAACGVPLWLARALAAQSIRCVSPLGFDEMLCMLREE